MDQPLTLAAIRALLEVEREERKMLSNQTAEGIEILRVYLERVCQENHLPVYRINNMNLPQVAQLAINTFQLASAVLLNKRVSDLQEAQASLVQQLRAENQRLMAEIASLNAGLAVDHPAQVEAQSESGEITASAIEEIPQEPAYTPLEGMGEITVADKILVAAATEGMIRMSALAEICYPKLHVSAQEFEAGMGALEKRGHLVQLRTQRKPPYGVVFPTVFHISAKGMEAFQLISGQSGRPILEMLTSANQNMWGEEGPLLAYAVEEYLPHLGYTFLTYAPETCVDLGDGNRQVFYPHALLRDPGGQEIFIMYEGERFDRNNLQKYLAAFRKVSADQLHFICLNGRIARNLSSHIRFLALPGEVKIIRITNIDDWELFEQQKRAGKIEMGDSIWFTSLNRKEKG
jgi:hypothetical protein